MLKCWIIFFFPSFGPGCSVHSVQPHWQCPEDCHLQKKWNPSHGGVSLLKFWMCVSLHVRCYMCICMLECAASSPWHNSFRFESVQCAQKAKAALNGADIYAGCCTLKIEYARVRRWINLCILPLKKQKIYFVGILKYWILTIGISNVFLMEILSCRKLKNFNYLINGSHVKGSVCNRIDTGKCPHPVSFSCGYDPSGMMDYVVNL